MPSLDEMIAQSTQYGALGGYRTAKKDKRTQEAHELGKKEKKVDIQTKQAELEDYLATRKTRRKKAEVERQRAQRELDLKKELDEQAKIQVEADISKLSNQLKTDEMLQVAQVFGSVRDQETYGLALQQIDPEHRKQWGLTEDYEESKKNIEYVAETAMRSVEHQRSRDILAAKNAAALAEARAAGSGGRKLTPMSGRFPTAQTEVMARNIMAQDPLFSKLGTDMDDEEFMFVTQQVSTRAQEIIMESNNKARKWNDPTKEKGPHKALQQAMTEQKVKMHKVEQPSTISGYVPFMEDNLTIELMEPKEYQEYKDRWFLRKDAEYQYLSPKYRELSQDQKYQMLEEMFLRERAAEWKRNTALTDIRR